MQRDGSASHLVASKDSETVTGFLSSTSQRDKCSNPNVLLQEHRTEHNPDVCPLSLKLSNIITCSI